MITLITGLPGASKTLNTLRIVQEECGERPVYYYGIDGLTLPWTELSLDELHQWFELPAGSVVVVDECQRVWPRIAPTKESPESVRRMDKHRHQGIDFYVITQRPVNCDSNLRGFVGRHLHYERMFSRNGAKQVEFQQCESDPRCGKARQVAQITYVPFKKSYFDVYKSAEVHTYKPRIPRAVWFMVAAMMVVAVCAWRLLDGWGSPAEVLQVPAQAESDSVLDEAFPAAVPEVGSVALTREEYLAQRVPRIEGIPWSAPMYDALTEPKSYPRPQCVWRHRSNVCKCYTQQATALDISQNVCEKIVEEGYFDPARPDQLDAPEQPQRAQRAALGAERPEVDHFAKPRIAILEDTPRISPAG